MMTLTIRTGGADDVQKIHDQVQVHLMILTAGEAEQLLLLLQGEQSSRRPAGSRSRSRSQVGLEGISLLLLLHTTPPPPSPPQGSSELTDLKDLSRSTACVC